MKSKAFSRHSDSFYDLLRSVRSCIVFPSAVMAVLFLSFTAELLYELVLSPRPQEHDLGDVYRFVFSDYSSDEVSLTFIFGFFLVFAGLFTAFSAFNFCTKADASNVVFSFGLKREQLFSNRLYVSLAAMFSAVFIPFFISLVANIFVLKLCGGMLEAFFFLVISFFLLELIGFSVGCAVIMVSGNIFEAFTASALTLLFPSGALEFVKMIRKFISASAQTYMPEKYPEGVRFVGDISKDFFFLEPITMFFSGDKNYFRYASCSAYTGEYSSIPISDVMPVSAWLMICVWLSAATLMLFFSRRRFFKRKVEIADTILVS
ncbi:MAG: hypothetical protein GX851_05260, partial [Clostridiales bacterium]|nr:hypothetical protein [Clostridiales bacterium]